MPGERAPLTSGFRRGEGWLPSRQLGHERAAHAQDEPGHEALHEQPPADGPRGQPGLRIELRRRGDQDRPARARHERHRHPQEDRRQGPQPARAEHAARREAEHDDDEREPDALRQRLLALERARHRERWQHERCGHLPGCGRRGLRAARDERVEERDQEAGQETLDLCHRVEQRQRAAASAAGREGQHRHGCQRGAEREQRAVGLAPGGVRRRGHGRRSSAGPARAPSEQVDASGRGGGRGRGRVRGRGPSTTRRLRRRYAQGGRTEIALLQPARVHG